MAQIPAADEGIAKNLRRTTSYSTDQVTRHSGATGFLSCVVVEDNTARSYITLPTGARLVAVSWYEIDTETLSGSFRVRAASNKAATPTSTIQLASGTDGYINAGAATKNWITRTEANGSGATVYDLPPFDVDDYPLLQTSKSGFTATNSVIWQFWIAYDGPFVE